MEIEINGVLYDPFFMIGVSQDATQNEITRAFKQKALLFHPDKATQEEKSDPSRMDRKRRHWSIITVCYVELMHAKGNGTKENINIDANETLLNSRENFNSNLNTVFSEIPSVKSEDWRNSPVNSTTTIDNYNSFNYKPQEQGISSPRDFNKMFDQVRGGPPQDTANRITSVDDYKEMSLKPSQNLEYSDYDKFNEVFEQSQNTSVQLFQEYNQYGGAYASATQVSLMGDNEDSNFADYRQAFSGARNP